MKGGVSVLVCLALPWKSSGLWLVLGTELLLPWLFEYCVCVCVRERQRERERETMCVYSI